MKMTFSFRRLQPMLLAAITLVTTAAFTQDLEAYKIYDRKGREVSFSEMAKDLVKNDVVLFGELHNNPICHWIQFEFSRYALSNSTAVSFGAEMFEADNQLVLDEYLRGTIKLDHLKKEAKVWPNLETDYLPLVDLARENGRPFIATNVPRRYAALVNKEGMAALDSLDDRAKAILPPLPYTVTINDMGYIDMREMMGMHNMGTDIDRLIAAQALKDYTMAHYVLKHLEKDGLFIHFNGSFHSQKYSGMYNYLKAGNKKLDIGVIATVEADDLTFQEDYGLLGDYVIVVPSSMTKTH